jgi:hypothetical protein
MSAYITPGRSKVYWVETVSDPSDPTPTEINAGTDLSAKLRGVPSVPRTGNLADISNLSSTFEARQRGTVGGDVVSFELLRDTLTETAYASMAEGDEGYLVILRKGIAGTQVAVGDIADVFPATVNTKGDGSPGRNDPDFAVFELAITANPSRDITITT